MKQIIKSYYQLKIKTDSYAGNFEREIAAYCTGITGDCGVGSKKAEIYNKEESINMSYVIQQMSDDSTIYRPTAIDDNNSMDLLIFFSDYYKNDISKYINYINIIKRRADKFSKIYKECRIKGLEFEEVIISKKVKSIKF